MADCKNINKLFDKALYNELTEKNNNLFLNHLNRCIECKTKFKALKETLILVTKREKEEANPQFLENLWDNIEPEIEKIESKVNWHDSIIIKIKSILTLEPTWTKQLAAGFTLLIIGILIGRNFVENKSQLVPDPIIENNNSTIIKAAVETKAERYLDRSKVLLLGLINYDENSDIGSMDLPRQKEISKKLVKQAAELKNELSAPEQRKLKQLISDLEVVLLQIANLESEFDLSGIDMVKSGVDQRGIFLKINIQKMQKSSTTQETDKDERIETNI